MALIRSLADARKYVRLSKLSNDALLPDFESIEILHLVPIIGQALYNKLNADYSTLNVSTSTTDVYVLCLRHCQRMVTPLAFADDMASNHTLITDNGIRTPESNQAQPAHLWEFNKLKDSLLTKSAQGMELLLRHLITNAGAISEYNNSAAHKQYQALAIKTALDFTKYYKLFDPFRTFHLLAPIVADVQEHYIVPIIGRQMLEWLKGRADAIITVDSVSVDMMLHFKKAIVCFTIKHAIRQLSVRISDAGLTVLAGGSNDENQSGRTNAPIFNFDRVEKEMENEGQNWLKDLERFMKGAYNGEFNNDFDADFDTAFQLSPLAPTAKAVIIETKNDERKIFVMGG